MTQNKININIPEKSKLDEFKLLIERKTPDELIDLYILMDFQNMRQYLNPNNYFYKTASADAAKEYFMNMTTNSQTE